MKFTMKKGEYYIGDLCYVMHDVWKEVCKKMLVNNSVENGKYKLDNGVEFAQFRTKFGDGIYSDQENRSYSVDSGTLGCILLSDIRKSEKNGLSEGHIINFEEDFNCYNVGGTIIFGHIKIKT